MEDFLKPEYFEAIGTAIKYGACVLLGMLVAGGLFTVVSGGLAARNWKKAPDGH